MSSEKMLHAKIDLNLQLKVDHVKVVTTKRFNSFDKDLTSVSSHN